MKKSVSKIIISTLIVETKSFCSPRPTHQGIRGLIPRIREVGIRNCSTTEIRIGQLIHLLTSMQRKETTVHN